MGNSKGSEILTPNNLNDTAKAFREQLRQHQQKFHQPGRRGLEVKGGEGATSITLTKGVGLDLEGRSLILEEDLRLDVPSAQAGTFLLMAYFKSDDRQVETPQFGWFDEATRLFPQTRLPLARIEVANGALTKSAESLQGTSLEVLTPLDWDYLTGISEDDPRPLRIVHSLFAGVLAGSVKVSWRNWPNDENIRGVQCTVVLGNWPEQHTDPVVFASVAVREPKDAVYQSESGQPSYLLWPIATSYQVKERKLELQVSMVSGSSTGQIQIGLPPGINSTEMKVVVEKINNNWMVNWVTLASTVQESQ